MKPKQWQALVAILLVVVGIEVYLVLSGDGGADEAPAAAASTVSSPPHLEAGERAQAFEAANFAGGGARVDFSPEGGPTFLFVFSPTCGSCRKTLPVWNRIVGETEGRARAFGLVMGDYQRGRAMLDEGRLGFPVLRFTDPELIRVYKVTQVPQTILVGPGGAVVEAIVGELADDHVDLLVELATKDAAEPSP